MGAQHPPAALLPASLAVPGSLGGDRSLALSFKEGSFHSASIQLPFYFSKGSI